MIPYPGFLPLLLGLRAGGLAWREPGHAAADAASTADIPPAAAHAASPSALAVAAVSTIEALAGYAGRRYAGHPARGQQGA